MTSTFRSATINAARTVTLLSLFSAAVMAHARPQDQMTHEQLHRRATQRYEGCYSSAGSLESDGSYMYQSTGYCGEQCTGKDQAVMGLTEGNSCWCGGSIPSDSDKVDDERCNSPCTGFGSDNCGGDGFFSVYLTGTSGNVPKDGDDSSSSSREASSSTSAAETVITSTSPGQTVVVTVPAQAPSPATTSDSANSPGESGGGGGTNTAGIAAGVVVGVVVVLAVIGGLVFWMKKKKRQQAEEDYKQRTQVSDFMRGANERKPPGTGYSGMSDQRLDPEAGARRNSVGSLADNQDYSRRILRVANPDSS